MTALLQMSPTVSNAALRSKWLARHGEFVDQTGCSNLTWTRCHASSILGVLRSGKKAAALVLV